MIKLSILMVRRSDLSYEEYLKYWREVHAPLFASQAESRKYVRRYIQNHKIANNLAAKNASDYDGIAEIWFDNIAGAKAFFDSDGYRKNVIPDELAFMDRERCSLLYSEEFAVIT